MKKTQNFSRNLYSMTVSLKLLPVQTTNCRRVLLKVDMILLKLQIYKLYTHMHRPKAKLTYRHTVYSKTGIQTSLLTILTIYCVDTITIWKPHTHIFIITAQLFCTHMHVCMHALPPPPHPPTHPPTHTHTHTHTHTNLLSSFYNLFHFADCWWHSQRAAPPTFFPPLRGVLA